MEPILLVVVLVVLVLLLAIFLSVQVWWILTLQKTKKTETTTTTVEAPPYVRTSLDDDAELRAEVYKEFGDDPEKAKEELARRKQEAEKAAEETRQAAIEQAITRSMNRLGDAMQNTIREIMTGEIPKEGDR